jgi:hypothetical protein
MEAFTSGVPATLTAVGTNGAWGTLGGCQATPQTAEPAKVGFVALLPAAGGAGAEIGVRGWLGD